MAIIEMTWNLWDANWIDPRVQGSWPEVEVAYGDDTEDNQYSSDADWDEGVECILQDRKLTVSVTVCR
jgi:hypothetical protein